MGSGLKILKKENVRSQMSYIVKQGLAPYAAVLSPLLGFDKTGMEILRLSVDNKALKKLRRQYKKKLPAFKEAVDSGNKESSFNDTIWICWLQGIDKAPSLVKRCYKSIKDNFKDSKIVVLDETNINDYVELPSYIMEKYEKGIITKTHFSDILRLELLSQYGGTWIDGTVYCSGWDDKFSYMRKSPFFMFQVLKPGADGQSLKTSSWYISSYSHNKIIELARMLLLDYWKTSNKLVNYFLVHCFVQLAIEQYPEEWAKVIPVSNEIPHILLLRINEKYDEELWNAVTGMTPFHKLTYKLAKSKTNDDYLSHILRS